METIASFQIDHLRLKPGLYVSRRDRFDTVELTTFDLRLKAPNKEAVMSIAAAHSLEHLLATYLRSDPEWNKRTVYVGPMGCRTGLYVIFEGAMDSPAALIPLRAAFEWIAAYTGPIPGAAPRECGNWSDHDLEAAKTEARNYLKILNKPAPENLVYPSAKD